MSKYVDSWHTVDHEFVDSKVNRAHKKVYEAAAELGDAIAKYTVTIDVDGRIRSVKPRHVRGPTPEGIKREAKEINDLRPAFAKAHAKFVRLANNRRLLEPIGDLPPAEFEQAYYRQHEPHVMTA